MRTSLLADPRWTISISSRSGGAPSGRRSNPPTRIAGAVSRTTGPSEENSSLTRLWSSTRGRYTPLAGSTQTQISGVTCSWSWTWRRRSGRGLQGMSCLLQTQITLCLVPDSPLVDGWDRTGIEFTFSSEWLLETDRWRRVIRNYTENRNHTRIEISGAGAYLRGNGGGSASPATHRSREQRRGTPS